MQNRRKGTQAKIEKKTRSFWLGLLLFVNIALLLSLFFGEMGVLNARHLKQVHASLRSEVDDIQHKNETLRHEKNALQSDMGAIERLARKELGFVKQGELVYQFFDENGS